MPIGGVDLDIESLWLFLISKGLLRVLAFEISSDTVQTFSFCFVTFDLSAFAAEAALHRPFIRFRGLPQHDFVCLELKHALVLLVTHGKEW